EKFSVDLSRVYEVVRNFFGIVAKKHAYRWVHRGTISTQKGEIITFRSEYELTYINKLEGDSTVVKFLYEPFRIPYTFQDKERVYIPDFLVSYTSGDKELVEVKPAALVNDAMNRSKFEAARDYCKEQGIKFSIIDPCLSLQLIPQRKSIIPQRASN